MPVNLIRLIYYSECIWREWCNATSRLMSRLIKGWSQVDLKGGSRIYHTSRSSLTHARNLSPTHPILRTHPTNLSFHMHRLEGPYLRYTRQLSVFFIRTTSTINHQPAPCTVIFYNCQKLLRDFPIKLKSLSNKSKPYNERARLLTSAFNSDLFKSKSN